MSEELTIIREMAERLLGEHCTPRRIAAAEAGEWPAALWDAVEEAGLTLALVSEGGGGVDLGWPGAMELAMLAGAHAAPIPLVETMLAAWLLDRAGQPVPSGPLTLAALEGERLVRVPWGRRATVIVLRDTDGGTELTSLDPTGVEWTHGANVAGEPRDDAVTGLADGRFVVSPISGAEMRRAGAALRAGQIAGALRRAADLTVRYATERAQFGRPLSQFQAIQQSLAVLATQASVAAAAADMAARAMAQAESAPLVGIAKARASETAGLASGIAHQIHGAIGFTLEHELQLSTRRLLSWRDEFGNETQWYGAFGDRITQAGGDQLWPTITQLSREED